MEKSVLSEEMIAKKLTPRYYKMLKKGRVAIAGLGGLGSPIAAALARSCVGELLLADMDKVEASNLNRQQYRISDIGRPKAEALKEIIHEINPFVKVTAINEKITAENAVSIFGDWPIVCEAFDDPEAKAMLVGTLLGKTNSVKLICGSGIAGHGDPNSIKTKKINERLYICGDGITEANDETGLFAPRVGICAMHQANMAIELILKECEDDNYDRK